MQLLRAGDPGRAREAFECLLAENGADVVVYLGLAHACHALKDAAAAMDAVDRALAIEPQNPQALVAKADLLAGLGDARGAAAHYAAAVNHASATEHLSDDLRHALARASARLAQYSQQFSSHLQQQLRKRGVLDEQSSKRFRDSIDILAGTKRIYFQEPRHYFFPELPHIQFYERRDFPWLEQVEAAAADIRAELLEILKDVSVFKPYVEAVPGRPQKHQGGMLDNPDWSAFYLWKHGRPVTENAARCPKTTDVLSRAPLCEIPNRAPSVLFSRLRPGARIPPHTGEINTRLICHLPLIVPPGCVFRVGNETRPWVEGRTWIFDDTIEHEAWNPSDQDRVILLFEIWRPELAPAERALVSAMFDVIGAYDSAATNE